MKRLVEEFIDSITMYRLVLYGLYLIIATAIGLSVFGQLSYTPLTLIMTLLVLVLSSYVVNRLFSWTFSVPYNPESWQITALILFFLVFPQNDLKGYLELALVAGIAMASKYVLAVRGRHIFNPAAIAVVISGLLGILGATWWVATLFLLPVVMIVGFLVTWKLRHFWMVGLYMFVSVALAGAIAKLGGHDLGDAIKTVIISGPMVFAGTIMLTEPLTSPNTKRSQTVYALIVGILGGLHLGWLSKPDVAISIGNMFSFMLGARRSVKLSFIKAHQIAPTTYEVLLKPHHQYKFKPGQYIELTLPHDETDDRGIRRVFSIASRPGAEYIRLGLVVPESPSTFKRKLLSLGEGTQIHATQIGGSFVLPRNADRPLVLIAGGIGITPFRAMLDQMIENRDNRQVTLFYAIRRQDMAVYTDIIEQARRALGLRAVFVITEPTGDWQGERGRLSVDMMKRYVDNLTDSKIYISGPNAMVEDFRSELQMQGVMPFDIVTDYFSGY